MRNRSLRSLALKPGTVAVAVATEEPERCFLCTAPRRPSYEDACDAYLLGVVDGIVAMTGEARAALCSKHETRMREMLVVKVQDASVYEKLGIETVTT